MLKNMKIGKRLITAFSIIIILFIVTSLIAISSILYVSGNLTEFYNGSFQVVKASREIQRDVERSGRIILWSCTTMNQKLTNERLAEAEKAIEGVLDNIPIIEKNFLEDRSIVDNLISALNEAPPVREKLIKLGGILKQ